MDRSRTIGSIGIACLLLAMFACAAGPDPWNRVRLAKDPAVFEAFLGEHPDSPHAHEARERVAILVEARDREQAERQGTHEALQRYVALHPNTEFADKARAELERSELEAAWEQARALDTRQAYVDFVAAHANAAHAAEARAAIERFEHAAQFERVSALDTLADWEAFIAARPDSEYRAKAGARIEALFQNSDQGSDDDRAMIRGVIARIQPYEEDADQGQRCFFVVEMGLAARGQPDHLLVKAEDYSYVALGIDVDQPAQVGHAGFDEPTLRYLAPLRVAVLRLSEETIFSDDERINQATTNLFFRLSKLAGIDFMDTKLLTCWPRDVESFKLGVVDGDPVSTLRGYVSNVLAPMQILQSIRRLPEEHIPWAIELLKRSEVAPTSLVDRVSWAVAVGQDERVLALGAASLPVLEELIAGASPFFARAASRALARLEPSGAAFDALGREARSNAALQLPEVIMEQPLLARGFHTKGLAQLALLKARAKLASDFAGEDDAAREAGRKLPLLGWDATLPANAVRRHALHDEWDEIVALGPPAILPLLAYLCRTTSERRPRVMLTLKELATQFGAQPGTDELLQRDAELRAIVVAARADGTGLGAVFGGEAANYIEASRSIDAMSAFARNTENPAWAAIAGQWPADGQGRALHELVAEGKLAWSVHGQSITSVVAELTNRVDHPIRVQIPVGTRFVPGSSRVQSMVSVGEEHLTLLPGQTTSHRVRVACANLERSIPGSKTSFELERVAPDSDLGRVLAQLGRTPQSEDITQAAVWLVTDDPTYASLGILRAVTTPGRSGTRRIDEKETIEALKVLDRAGVDVRKRRVWPLMPTEMAKFPGWRDPWFERMRAAERDETAASKDGN